MKSGLRFHFNYVRCLNYRFSHPLGRKVLMMRIWEIQTHQNIATNILLVYGISSQNSYDFSSQKWSQNRCIEFGPRLSFGGGYIYTVKLASDLWLETGQEWYPGTWPPSGFNYVANGPDPSSDDPWVEAPFLHPIMVKLKQLLCRIRIHHRSLLG